ncbi:tenascin-like isoform X1 [Hippocampus zosterae]|uniref:tenascin-like isoform X1 n=1 Tax=Hippocampus zosterae TaxID=109293 RepID=UPI00223E252C|nr:tenascin-like isoform X1 [Hippocampus zosterae]XP_051906161.1 tenascin-like isoform X1 [Hippocampus zosterae]
MAARVLVICLLASAWLGFSAAGLVRKVLRHRRQVPPEHNVTSRHQSVVFNHVYNINVPDSHLCSVDLDAAESSAETDGASGRHFSADGESQIIFTHRINIPRGACGCAADSPRIGDLMSRIEMLEGEVSALRRRCDGSGGGGDTGPPCGGRGNYSAETSACTCEPGWKGSNCTEPECPEGFFGDDCSRSVCPDNCKDRGPCQDGRCVCKEPWTGSDCSELLCPLDCFGRGLCLNGTCHCQPGFSGEDCGRLACLADCHGNGMCVDGRCACAAGYGGEDCSRLTCLNDCSDRGACFDGICVCRHGYGSDDCSHPACPDDCNGRGRCVNGRCACDVGFRGDDCGEISCPNDCLRRGRCVNGQCVCREGFGGEDCGVRTCPSDCYGRGACIEGRCECHAGFGGDDCALLTCPDGCRNRGRCLDGRCVCDEGFAGEDCGRKACPNDCLARGRCDDGECVCREGYSGPDCSRLTCPDECNGRGRCVGGSCECQSGYRGESCAERSCLNGCRDRGLCVEGRCACDEGYVADDCSEVSPPKDLTVGEVTSDTVNLSWINDMLVTEYLVTYGPARPGGLLSDLTVPGDRTGAALKDLEPGLEYRVNVYAVLGDERSVPVGASAATALPQPDGMRFTSVTETAVEVEWEQLNVPFDGWEIGFRNTKEENGKVVSTVPPSQKRFLQSGLGPGQEYEVSVSVIKNNATGPPAVRRVATNIDAPRQLRVSDVSDSSALISWSKPAAPTDRFTLFCKPSRASSEGAKVEIFPPDGQHSLEGLKPDTEYKVSLVARSQDVSSEPAVATFTTALDAPRELLATRQTEDSITLMWRNTLADVDGYRVKYGPLSGAAHGEEVFSRGPGQSTTATITGLKPGTEYGVGVTSVKNERESLPATINAATDLDPPRGLEQTESAETAIRIRWEKPHAKVSRYRLVYVSRDGQVEEAEIAPSETTFVLADLTPATSYAVTLTAERGHRMSSPVTLNVSTEAAGPWVANLTFSDVTWDGFTASWSPSGGDFDSLVVEVTNLDNTAQSQNLSVSGDALSLGLRGLNANTTYMVGLYPLHQGVFLEPVFAEATTARQPSLGQLFVSNVTSESFLVVWDHTEGRLDGFVLEIIDSDWLMEPREYNLSRLVTAHQVTGLRPDSDYVAYLYGTFKGARTGAVSVVATTAEEPDLSRLVVANVTSDSVSLTWRAGAKVFDNFVVEVRESALPSQAMGQALPGRARSTVMAGLKARTRYDIKLYASAGGRNTPPLFAVATTEDAPLLGPVTALSAGPHNLSVSWSVASGHFDDFVVRVGDAEQESESREFRLPGHAANLTVSDLMDATGYNVEVYGFSHGRRTPSTLVHAITAPLPKVENLTISNVTPFGFRVSWGVKQRQSREESAHSAGAFSHFNLVVTDSGWLLEPQKFTVPGNQTHLDVWGLITGIGYEIRLTGVSRAGLFSRPLTAVAVTEAEPEVEHLFVSDITADGFRVSWAADEDLFDRFVIKLRDSKRLSRPQEHTVHGDERTRLIAGLMPGTEYEIELYGLSLDHRSQPIFGVAQTGLTTPKGLRFSDVTDSSAVVHWSTPQSAVDNYYVTYVPFEGGSPMSVTVDGDVLQALLPNMSPGRMYQVTVSAVKGLEESEPSGDVVTTALDTPEGLTAVNITDSSARLQWRASVATVDGYVITYNSESGSPMVERVSETELEIAPLLPGTLYSVELVATRGAQTSASALTEFTTKLDAPRDLVALNIQTDSATLTWRPPQAAISGYSLTFSASDGSTRREVMLSPTASSYNMAQLTRSTEYTVQLQAISTAERSRHATAVFSTVGQLHRHPKDCAQIFLNGERTTGVYSIYVAGVQSQVVQVYCDMETDGGGWTVFLRRQNGRLEFFRNWKNYTAGFGNIKDEFWLGLGNLHKITTAGQYVLRIDLRDAGESAFAQYDKFSIAEPRTRYKLYIGAYSGTAGDSMTYHQGRPFSTFDNDNDIAVTNCALSYKGAFWYKNCHRVNLMGKYGDKSHSKGVNWFHWKGHETSIEFAEMKLRPADFGNSESRRKRS